MNNQHPWTQPGIELLQTIHKYIDDNGGREALAEAINNEWRPEYETCPESFTKIREQVIDLYGKVSRPLIAEMVGINESRVAAILKDLMKTGRVKTPRMSRVGMKYRKGKKIRERHERREQKTYKIKKKSTAVDY